MREARDEKEASEDLSARLREEVNGATREVAAQRAAAEQRASSLAARERELAQVTSPHKLRTHTHTHTHTPVQRLVFRDGSERLLAVAQLQQEEEDLRRLQQGEAVRLQQLTESLASSEAAVAALRGDLQESLDARGVEQQQAAAVLRAGEDEREVSNFALQMMDFALNMVDSAF